MIVTGSRPDPSEVTAQVGLVGVTQIGGNRRDRRRPAAQPPRRILDSAAAHQPLRGQPHPVPGEPLQRPLAGGEMRADIGDASHVRIVLHIGDHVVDQQALLIDR